MAYAAPSHEVSIHAAGTAGFVVGATTGLEHLDDAHVRAAARTVLRACPDRARRRWLSDGARWSCIGARGARAAAVTSMSLRASARLSAFTPLASRP